MIRYRLASLVEGRRKGSTAQLPKIAGTLAAEREYLKALRTILREMARETRENIVPLAVAEMQANRAMVKDAETSWFTRLLSIAARLTSSAEAMVERILRLDGERHTKRFVETARRTLGIDLSAVVREGDLEALLRNAGLKNAALIKGFSDDMAVRVQRMVLDAVISGRPAAELRKDLTKQFQIGDRRAQLIARTEMAKINAEMNMLRQQQAGVTSYVYRTSADERVRATHAAHEGKTFSWKEPPSTGHPGTEPNCRCIAQAIVEF